MIFIIIPMLHTITVSQARHNVYNILINLVLLEINQMMTDEATDVLRLIRVIF